MNVINYFVFLFLFIPLSQWTRSLFPFTWWFKLLPHEQNAHVPLPSNIMEGKDKSSTMKNKKCSMMAFKRVMIRDYGKIIMDYGLWYFKKFCFYWLCNNFHVTSKSKNLKFCHFWKFKSLFNIPACLMPHYCTFQAQTSTNHIQWRNVNWAKEIQIIYTNYIYSM